MDYSVCVSDMNRKEIFHRLVKEKGLVREQSTEQMRKSLAKELKKKHPIHDKVKMLSSTQLFELCTSLNLKVYRREKGKMSKLIVDHFFNQYPDAPLTDLERVMIEDAYFAELTGM